MSTCRPFTTVCAAAVCWAVLCQTGPVAIAEPPTVRDVEIEIHDGRILRGSLVESGDEGRIALFTRTERIELTSTFPAEMVRSVRDAEHQVITSPDQARPLPVAPPPQVAALQVAALRRPVRTGLRSEELQVSLMPFDTAGRPLLVTGIVTVTLEVPVIPNVTGRRRAVRDPEPPRLEKWTRRVSPADFGPGGAMLCLPLRNSPSDDDRLTVPDTLDQLRVVLSVPAQADVEAHAVLVPNIPPAYQPLRARIIEH